MVSGSDSAPPRLGNVADGSSREDASPLSLPGPFTDSDSEPCVSNQTINGGEEVEQQVADKEKSMKQSSHSQPYMKSHDDACFDSTV